MGAKVYLAPMEGVTGHNFRQVYRKYFEDPDRYFTPFISIHEKLGKKEKEELLPANNQGQNLVPQIMAASPEEAAGLLKLIRVYGYEEINLNTGCPSGTVVNKNRGAGILRDPEGFDRLLDGIFEKCDCRISLKTRMGWESTEEWYQLSQVIGKYPFTEVIVHGRVRQEFYKGQAHQDCLELARENIKSPLIYNGDIYSVSEARKLLDKYDWIDGMMLGRGVLTNPWLITDIHRMDDTEYQSRILEAEVERNQTIYSFLTELYQVYLELFKSEINTLYHMKEIWNYLGASYPEKGKELKIIKKTKNKREYEIAIRDILCR